MSYSPRIKDRQTAIRALYRLINDTWRNKITDLDKARFLRSCLDTVIKAESPGSIDFANGENPMCIVRIESPTDEQIRQRKLDKNQN